MGQGEAACQQPAADPTLAQLASKCTAALASLTLLPLAAPASLRLEWGGSEAEVRTALRARAQSALPAERDAAGGLKRTVLRCLLERGLSQRSDGSFELQPVVTAPLGEAVSRALTSAPDGQRALYKKAGHTLEQLLTSLQSAGIISITSVYLTKYAAVQPGWLQQPGRLPAAGAAPGPAAAAVVTPAHSPVAAVAAAPAAVVQPAHQCAAMSLELDLCDFPVIMGGNLTASPAEIAFRFTISINKCIPGGQVLRDIQHVHVHVHAHAHVS